MTLVGHKTAQSGDIKAQSLKLTGGYTFENLGDIDVEQGLSLELSLLSNKGSLSTGVINCSKALQGWVTTDTAWQGNTCTQRPGPP